MMTGESLNRTSESFEVCNESADSQERRVKMAEKRAEDLANDLKDLEVTELDDKDLEGTAGGANRIDDVVSAGPNTNCGCGGFEFTGVAGEQNINCGCPA